MIVSFPPRKTPQEKSRELDEFLEVRQGADWGVRAPVNFITTHGVVSATDPAFLTAALHAMKATSRLGPRRRRGGAHHPAA